MIAMPHGVILEKELARQRGVRVERHRSSSIKLLIAQRADRGRGGRAVLPEEIQRRLFRHRVIVPGVRGIDLVHLFRRDAHNRLASGEYLRQLNLQRIHAGDVMDDDSNLAAVSGKTCLPLRVSGHACKSGKRMTRPTLLPRRPLCSYCCVQDVTAS